MTEITEGGYVLFLFIYLFIYFILFFGGGTLFEGILQPGGGGVFPVVLELI